MSSPGVVSGVPGQPAVVSGSPGVVGVPERQEVLGDSGSRDPGQSQGCEVSAVREDSGLAVTDLHNISTVLDGEGHGSGGEVSPTATGSHQESSSGPARGPAPGNLDTNANDTGNIKSSIREIRMKIWVIPKTIIKMVQTASLHTHA